MNKLLLSLVALAISLNLMALEDRPRTNLVKDVVQTILDGTQSFKDNPDYCYYYILDIRNAIEDAIYAIPVKAVREKLAQTLVPVLENIEKHTKEGNVAEIMTLASHVLPIIRDNVTKLDLIITKDGKPKDLKPTIINGINKIISKTDDCTGLTKAKEQLYQLDRQLSADLPALEKLEVD